MSQKRNRNDSTIHSNSIKKLVLRDPELETSGFKKAITELMQKHDYVEDAKSVINKACNFYPDAYKIGENEVVIYEVEDSSAISADKMTKITDLFNYMDFYGLNLRLIVTDRYAANYTEVDLAEEFLVTL